MADKPGQTGPASQVASLARHKKLGRISFDDALLIQNDAISQFRATGEGLPVIFSLEHDPVITCGRSTDEKNLLLTRDEYKERGIQVRDIDRGGDVTYHGPGQVVIYPILLLRMHNLRVGDFIRILEEAMIKTCNDWGILAFRRSRYPGCWTEKGKIGAVGAAIKSGGITKHGLSFKVSINLDNYGLIVPCGIQDSEVVRLSDLVEGDASLENVEDRLVGHLADLLGLKLIS